MTKPSPFHLFFILLTLVLCSFARADVLERPIQDEVFYFVLPDRFFNADPGNDTGGVDGDKFSHGFDPTDKAYYHGGDLQGLTAKLDYLKGMGITAIWMGPVFKNKPVQTDANGTSAGYHGYWTIDFTQVDPHFGTNDDLKTLVEKAHEKDIRVFFDIIANHTADVIEYRQCHDPTYDGPDKEGPGNRCVYRTIAEYPYTTLGGVAGPSINEGFLGDDVQTEENFAKLTDPRWAYVPYVPEEEKGVKVPAWLNDPIYYHNRGESTYSGENSQYGDFVSLDDLFTEHPRVVEGMIEIFEYWIREFRIDGFRVDTVKHVNTEFWQQFAPAIVAYAKEQGIPEFFVFGEVYDSTPEFLSIYTTEGRLPAVLDFGFQGTVGSLVTTPKPTDELKGFFEKDDYYIDADSDAYELPTFIGNHDMGRIGYFIQQAVGDSADEAEMLKRSRLGHALMYFARGIPVVYYGDEQGFTGDGNDQDAREDMFPAQVASYNDNNLLGTDATTAVENFDTDHPLYQALQQFGAIYQAHEPLRRGVQIHRYSTDSAGIYAFSRIDPQSRQEYVLAFNNATEPKTARFQTYAKGSFSAVYPADDAPISAGDTLTVEVPALDFVIFKADQPIPPPEAVPAVAFVSPVDKGVLIKDQFVSVDLSEDMLADVNFEAKIGDGEFQPLGRDTNPPYRVFFKVGDHPDGTPITFRATAGDYAGHTQTAEVAARIDTRLPRVTVDYQNGNGRDSVYAISSTGGVIFPQPLADNRIIFDWPEGADGVTVIFESRDGQHFRFDTPVYLSLTDTVMPQSREENGELAAELQIDTRPALPDDPAPEAPLPETVHVRGGMNAWKDTDPLDYVGNYTYHRRIALAADWIEFKFADETWQSLNVGAPVGPHGASGGSNPGNLRMRVPEGQGGLYDVHFFAYPQDEGHYFFYRFEQVEAPLGKTIYLRGSLVGTWDANESYAFSYQGDDVYSLETVLNGGERLEFKIADADWSAGTNFGVAEGTTAAPGEPVTLADNGGNIEIDLETARYRLSLNVSDRSAPKLTVVKTGEADLGPYGKPLYLKGTLNEWSNREDFKFDYQGEDRFVLTATLEPGAYEFKIADADWSADSDFGDGVVTPNEPVTLILQGGNMSLNVEEGGLFRFEVNAGDKAVPVLTVSPLGPYGAAIYLRGAMNEWGASESFRLRYLGDNRYELQTELAAGDYEFKIADATWGSVNLGALEGDAGNVGLGEPKTLARRDNPGNLKLSIPAEGRYGFGLEAEDLDAPVLTVFTD